jgi:hypothetical protein
VAERGRRGWRIAQAPCCKRGVRLPEPPEDEAGGDEEEPRVWPLICNPCKVFYRVKLVQEPDLDGWGPFWLAEFEIAYTEVATATYRTVAA